MYPVKQNKTIDNNKSYRQRNELYTNKRINHPDCIHGFNHASYMDYFGLCLFYGGSYFHSVGR